MWAPCEAVQRLEPVCLGSVAGYSGVNNPEGEAMREPPPDEPTPGLPDPVPPPEPEQPEVFPPTDPEPDEIGGRH